MKIISFITMFLVLVNNYSQIRETVHSGEWDDASTWVNGVLPGTNCIDSIIIKHIVTYSDSLTFHKPVLVDIRGVLCGFDPLVFFNSKLNVYGTIRVGQITAYTSQIYMDNNHKSYISGMLLSGIGGWFKTGPNHQGVSFTSDFDCSNESLTTLETLENEIDNLIIYPNPVEGKIYIKGDITDFKIEVYSLTGKLINYFENVFDINLQDLESGSYVMKIIQKNENSFKSYKFIKL
jgi:hypothetical protein